MSSQAQYKSQMQTTPQNNRIRRRIRTQMGDLSQRQSVHDRQHISQASLFEKSERIHPREQAAKQQRQYDVSQRDNEADFLGEHSNNQDELSESSEVKTFKINNTNLIGSRLVRNEGKGKGDLGKLEEIQVRYKNIDDYERQENAKQEAREFVRRINKQKESMYGRYYSLKMEISMQKRRKNQEKQYQESRKKEEEKLKKMKEREKRIDFFRERATEREHKLRKRKLLLERNSSKSPEKTDKNIRIKSELSLPKPEVKESTKLGNSYLKQSGKIRKRTRTQASMYKYLDHEEREELRSICKKIQIIKSLQQSKI